MTKLAKTGKSRHAGMFKPGESGNPSGRSKESYRVSDLAKEHTETALATLVEICTNQKAQSSARVAAAEALLNRAWGKPIQAVETSGTLTYVDLLGCIAKAEERYQASLVGPQTAPDVITVESSPVEIDWQDLV